MRLWKQEKLMDQLPKTIAPPAPDGVAIGISTLCLVHCLGVPILIAVIPALSSALALPESLQVIAFLFAVPASAFALLIGYRHHGALLPASFGVLGLLVLGAGALGGQPNLVETGLTVSGSLMLAAAHVHNWRLRRVAQSAAGERA